MMLALLFRYYLYFLCALFTLALVLIIGGKDWAVCANLYLKVVIWIQDRLLELNGINCKEAGCYFVDTKKRGAAAATNSKVAETSAAVTTGNADISSSDEAGEEEEWEEEEGAEEDDHLLFQEEASGSNGKPTTTAKMMAAADEEEENNEVFEPSNGQLLAGSTSSSSGGSSVPASPVPSSDSFELVQFPPPQPSDISNSSSEEEENIGDGTDENGGGDDGVGETAEELGGSGAPTTADSRAEPEEKVPEEEEEKTPALKAETPTAKTQAKTTKTALLETAEQVLRVPHFPALELALRQCGQGVQAIAREDMSVNFTLASDYRRYELAPLQKALRLRLRSLRLLKRRRRSSTNSVNNASSSQSHSHNNLPAVVSYGRVASATRYRYLCGEPGRSAASGPGGSGGSQRRRRQPSFRPRALLIATLVFRLFALFPVRVALLTCSFLLLAISCFLNLVWPFAPLLKTRIAVIYCRMYTMGCGFIIRFHGTENRPRRPGIICSNHLSPNDVHVIFADIPLDRDYLYLVTGQKHKGFIWALEHLVEKMCPALWLERADPESRRRFSVEVVEAAKNSGPVILFPEGYCTNNSQVLQFRRAVFQEEINVFPVAIRQESRFGDSFWSEDHFLMYLLRVLTSWAIVYNVYYLPPQQKRPEETATEFAARVQRLIATRVGVRSVPYGGELWYKEPERRKALAEAQRANATEIREKFVGQWVIENEIAATEEAAETEADAQQHPLTAVSSSSSSTDSIEKLTQELVDAVQQRVNSRRLSDE